MVQRKLGAIHAWGFDLAAACAGFVYGLIVAAKLIESGAARRVLLCGGDRMSSVVNPEDRATAVLFGDGARTVLIEPVEDESVGILDYVCHMNGEGGILPLHPGRGERRARQRRVSSGETALRRAGRAERCTRPPSSAWPK